MNRNLFWIEGMVVFVSQTSPESSCHIHGAEKEGPPPGLIHLMSPDIWTSTNGNPPGVHMSFSVHLRENRCKLYKFSSLPTLPSPLHLSLWSPSKNHLKRAHLEACPRSSLGDWKLTAPRSCSKMLQYMSTDQRTKVFITGWRTLEWSLRNLQRENTPKNRIYKVK